MSAARHDQTADEQTKIAQQQQQLYDPHAQVEVTHCMGVRDTGRVEPCWTSVVNPTDEHRRKAAQHRRIAAAHRAAAAALRDAEAQACAGLSPDDRDMSPFMHTEDIARIEPLVEIDRSMGAGALNSNSGTAVERVDGVLITFRAVPGLTAEWLQRIVNCHLARNAALGYPLDEMPTCPLVPKGVSAEVISTGESFAVAVRGDSDESIAAIRARAALLRKAMAPQ